MVDCTSMLKLRNLDIDYHLRPFWNPNWGQPKWYIIPKQEEEEENEQKSKEENDSLKRG